jgi:PAS domain S-box-containing protein
MAIAENVTQSTAWESDRLRRWLRGTFIAVALIFTTALALTLAFHRETAIWQGQKRAETLAFILGDHLARTIAAVDTAVGQLALVGSRMGGDIVADPGWPAILDAARKSSADIASLSIVDQTGTIRHSTFPTLVGVSRADTKLFRELSTKPEAGLVVDTPLRGSFTGQIVIPLGRRLIDKDGRFVGTVVATFQPERLREFYRTIAADRGGMIWLLGEDLRTLIVETSAGTAAHDYDGSVFGPHVGPRARAGAFVAPLTASGPRYVNAFQRVDAPPLVIAASIPESTMLSAFWIDAGVSAFAVICFVALLIFAWKMIDREMRRRAEAEAQIVSQSAQLAQALHEREQTDAALLNSQAQFQSIMDHSPMQVALRDMSGRFIFVNRAYVEFAGQPEDSIIGKTFHEVRPKDHADKAAEQDRDVILNRKAMQWEMTLQKPHGLRTILLVKFPVFNKSGDMVALGAIVADITEQKLAEVQLSQAQRIDALGQLTGGIAHDFNNLLTSILLNADVLSSLVDGKLQPLAESVRQAAERGADLTRRLLAFGRRQMLEPRPTNVTELLTGMTALMRRTLGEHVEIRLAQEGSTWSATVDPNQLENAVVNLAVNARDAMPNGGKLTIEIANAEIDAERTADAEIAPGQYVTVSVTDEGSGMPPEIVARAFEPFFTTKDVGKGTGLGLSMVYGFVKQSGGHVTIDSKVGRGTVVTLYLPRSMAVEAQAQPAAPIVRELPSGTETILFVEDDAMVRQHTGRQIVSLGYDVVTAENAAEALAHVEKGCVPDLLFTDVVMPGGTNGRQLALKLRERWPDLRVLYTSGYAHGRLTIDGESVPTKYVLGKPYRRSDLAAKLREVLDEVPPRMARGA